MSPGKPQDPNKSDFERDLDAFEGQYREMGGEDPPAMLDQAVLNKARQAVEARSIRPWNFGWMHATATTAVILLGLTLILHQETELPSSEPGYSNKVIDKLESAPESKQDRLAESYLLDERVDNRVDKPSSQSPELRLESLEQVSRQQVSGDDDRLRDLNKRLDQPDDSPGEQDAVASPSSSINAFSTSTGFSELAREPAIEEEIRGEAEKSIAPETADSWLERILDLKQQDNPAWKSELEQFREIYPDHPLPDELSSFPEDE